MLSSLHHYNLVSGTYLLHITIAFKLSHAPYAFVIAPCSQIGPMKFASVERKLEGEVEKQNSTSTVEGSSDIAC
jgi:hypothetical protein